MMTSVYHLEPDGQVRWEWRFSFNQDFHDDRFLVRVHGLWRMVMRDGKWEYERIEGNPELPEEVKEEALRRFRNAVEFDTEHYDTRRKLLEGIQQAEAGELVDGPTAFADIRRALGEGEDS